MSKKDDDLVDGMGQYTSSAAGVLQSMAPQGGAYCPPFGQNGRIDHIFSGRITILGKPWCRKVDQAVKMFVYDNLLMFWTRIYLKWYFIDGLPVLMTRKVAGTFAKMAVCLDGNDNRKYVS